MISTKTLEETWAGVLESIKPELKDNTFELWLKPLKVVITNYPEDGEEMVDAVNHPGDPEAGKRPVPFSRELYIEQNDFMEDPPRKFFRLGPGREVRFRYAYYVTCQEVIKDDHGTVTELRCT